MNISKYILSILILLAVLILPIGSNRREFPEYLIVLDPGHGGLSLQPREIHGDRYDPISGEYLDDFKDGASYRKLEEHAIVYRIARKAKKLLNLCSTDGDYQKFFQILRRYTDSSPVRIIINPHMSRGDSTDSDAIRNRRDPNGEFRLFDFPDENGIMQAGRISRINALKPQLVVTIHVAARGPGDYRGLNPIIVPPYKMLFKGLRYLREEITSRKFLYNSKYGDWFSESSRRSDFHWFLKDVSAYFTGHTIREDNSINIEDFRGYRHNMVGWQYRDHWGWEYIAQYHPAGTRYAQSYRTFTPNGKFWKRERSIFERYRRDGGIEGYGGDNYYASAEIIRYILLSLSLKKKGRLHKDEKLTKPYISIWSVPIHINAISAFIELGYLRVRSHRRMLTKRQNEIAEGIAVGIYSLLAGLELKEFNFKYQPKGKSIDLKKYYFPNEENYFTIVTDK